MEPTESRQSLQELSIVGRAFTHVDLSKCAQLSITLERLLYGVAEAMVLSRAQEPIMYVYMCDGWSCDISSRFQRTHSDLRVDRQARSRQEFLLERGILRCRSAGDQDHRPIAMVMKPPRCLSQGKAAWNIVTSATEFVLACACLGTRASRYRCLCWMVPWSTPFVGILEPGTRSSTTPTLTLTSAPRGTC